MREGLRRRALGCALSMLVLGLAPSLAPAEDAAPEAPAEGPAPMVRFECRDDVDWGPYEEELKLAVRQAWRIPEAARRGHAGAVTLHFFLTREGCVSRLEVVRQTGPKALAKAARKAVEDASPFAPPPLPAESEDDVGVTWSFFYNFGSAESSEWMKGLPKPACAPDET